MNARNCRSKARLIGAGLLLMLSMQLASAQQVRLPRAASPLILLGFESPNAADSWTGMKCALSKTNVSEGNSSLAIFYPKWNGGRDNQWLSASLSWDGGKGFAEQDWSHYGKIAFDAWVDGSESLEISIELQSEKKGGSFTKELLVKPGAKNRFEVSLEDAAALIDITHVQTITVYGIRPKRDITLSIDNVALLPGDKLPIAAFDLIYPNYRDMILPGAPDIQVRAELQTGDYGLSPADITLSVTAKGKRTLVSSKAQATGNSVSVSLPAAKLPYGSATLEAIVTHNKTGKPLATNTWKLRKITQNEAAALKTYIDENNNMIVNGKPYFPIGWFGNTSLDQLEEIAGGPFNTILPYGVNGKSKSYITRYLDRVQETGMKLIYCMNDIYPTATYYDKTGWEGIFGNSNIADAVVNTFKHHPAILAWYLNDERPKELMPKFVDYYKQAWTNDPAHPSFIVIYNLSEIKYFPSTTDIMGVDRYPIPMDPITTITQEMKIAKEAVKGHKPVFAVVQAFGWYQYNDAFPDRGRIPTEEDLKAGRIPTGEETKNMAYQAIVNGANGLFFYCYYDLRVLPQYPKYWAELKSIAGELKVLSPIILSPKNLGAASCSPADANIETLLKELDGELYLIAVNTSDKPRKVTFDVKQALPSKISVMFEGRFAMDIQGTQLTDSFKPLEVHVYDLGRKEVTGRPVGKSEPGL